MHVLSDLLPSIPAGLLVIGLLVSTAGAVVQGVIGVGFAVISVPLLLVLDSRLAPAPQLLMSMPIIFSMAWRERHVIEPRTVAMISVGRLPGSVIGGLFLASADRRLMEAVIALLVLLSVFLIGKGLRVRRRPETELAAGFASGVMGAVASIGGPAVALLFVGEPPEVVRGNLAAAFSIGVLMSTTTRIVAGAISWTDVEIALWLLPGVALGLWVSRHLAHRVGREGLRRGVLAVCSLAGLGIIARIILRA